MIVADRLKQYSMRPVQMRPHDRPGSGDIIAGFVPQAAVDGSHRHPGITGKRFQPHGIDLHYAEVTTAISIGMFKTGISPFYSLNGGQDTRRQMIQCCDQRHAAQIGNAHDTPYNAGRHPLRHILHQISKSRYFISASCRKRVSAPSPHPLRDAGFTLIELLVVIAILGLLIGLVAPAALRQLGGARTSIARQSIERIGQVLDLYKLDVGSYPSTEDGLQALVTRPADTENWNGPYVKDGRAPLDPWNHPYLYHNPSERAGHDYDLCSAGPTGRNDETTHQICNP